MAILADHNYPTWKASFDFGTNFAFNYIVNQQFTSYLSGADNEMITLQLPILIHIKLAKDEEKRQKLIETMLDKRYCSLATLKLKSEVRSSAETLDQIRIYRQTYLNQTRNCLAKLKESDSKHALLHISDNLIEIK